MTTKDDNIFDFIYEIVKQIPKGKVTSYGAIAKCIGSGSSARLVGWAMNAAHAQPEVPAHRVVNRNGMLTGKAHFATPTLMQELLEAEGITVKNDTIVNFQQHFWNPAEMIDD